MIRKLQHGRVILVITDDVHLIHLLVSICKLLAIIPQGHSTNLKNKGIYFPFVMLCVDAIRNLICHSQYSVSE